MDKVFHTEDELITYASEIIKIPFNEIDKTNRLQNKKGGIGQMVEESHFGYSVNSKSEADFKELGIELKVTPFYKKQDKKTNQNIYRAKERLVLNIINYMNESLDNFEESSFWKKNAKILMMFYEHQNELDKLFWWIDDLILFKWPKEDFPIIQSDWEIITSKIKEGKAHELSESDTMYLSACTKGATATSSLRDQPFSDIKAKQRAYSIKPSYMSYILNNYVYGDKEDDAITKSFEFGSQSSNISEKLIDLQTQSTSFSVHDYINKTIQSFIGKTQEELVNEFNIKKSKQTNASIINRIFMLNGDIKNTDEFIKANIIPKTIRLESNGSIREHMSFQTFKFDEIINQEWEESDFYSLLANATFMFIVFQKSDNKDTNSTLKGIKFWSMSEEDLLYVKTCWETLKQVLINGVILTEKNGIVKNNFPKASDNPVSHVRPHASNSAYRTETLSIGKLSDADELPDGRWMTKQSFWLNKDYIESIISDLIDSK